MTSYASDNPNRIVLLDGGPPTSPPVTGDRPAVVTTPAEWVHEPPNVSRTFVIAVWLLSIVFLLGLSVVIVTARPAPILAIALTVTAVVIPVVMIASTIMQQTTPSVSHRIEVPPTPATSAGGDGKHVTFRLHHLDVGDE